MFNFALVGCGSMAHWHAQQLKKIPEVKVVALVDTDRDRTAQFGKQYFQDAAEFESLEKLFDAPPAVLDAVVLVTPHALHYPQARAALQRGINVLVEKPMVTRLEHALDLSRIVKQTGKVLGITFQAPYTQEYQCLKRMRDSGQMGKITLISGWLSQGWLEGTKNTWRQDAAISGGGQMYDAGAHTLNSIMWLIDSPVVDVACFQDRCGTAVDINGVAIMKFQNGAMASVSIGGTGVGWDTMIHVQADRVLAKTAPHGGWLELQGLHGRKVYPQITIDEHPAAGTPHLNFVNTLLGKESIQCGPRYGVQLSALMDALYRSADTHEIVRVKPVTEEGPIPKPE